MVISTLSLLSVVHQDALASCAKAAGVKLFVPSQFDCDPCGKSKIILLKHREAFRRKLKEIDLPYAVFCTGLFTDKLLAPYAFRIASLQQILIMYSLFPQSTFAAALYLDFQSGEFSIPGSGTSPISWTTTEELAQIIAHVLTTFPQDKIEWNTFRVEGERIVSPLCASLSSRANKQLFCLLSDGRASTRSLLSGKNGLEGALLSPIVHVRFLKQH